MAAIIDRRAIRAALRERLASYLPSVRSWLGRPVEHTQVKAKPGAALYNVAQESAQDPGRPPIWTLSLVLELHVEAAGGDVDDQLDEMIGQVESALQRQSGESSPNPGSEHGTTLGGLVFDSRIAGTIDFFSIVELGFGMAQIPLEVTTGPA
jgi:hypothetical protein